MKSEKGGYMPVYNSVEIAALTANGWQLVPDGEWPNPPGKKKIEQINTPEGIKKALKRDQNRRYNEKKRAEKLK
jgi:hypothetical protein